MSSWRQTIIGSTESDNALWEWKFTFGKYRGYTLRQIAEKDISYINWVYSTIGWFHEMVKSNVTVHAKLSEWFKKYKAESGSRITPGEARYLPSSPNEDENYGPDDFEASDQGMW